MIWSFKELHLTAVWSGPYAIIIIFTAIIVVSLTKNKTDFLLRPRSPLMQQGGGKGLRVWLRVPFASPDQAVHVQGILRQWLLRAQAISAETRGHDLQRWNKVHEGSGYCAKMSVFPRLQRHIICRETRIVSETIDVFCELHGPGPFS